MPGRGERALVTGGSGFVGACLARDLLAAGHKVHLILRAEAREWRLTDILPHCIVHRADLRDAGAVGAAVEGAPPAVV
jgi:nucleoside-diphosphate-sugar epimerase